MADFNSTDPNVQVEGAQNDQSGEQEKVVDSQESHNNAYEDFVIVDDGHAGAVDQHDTDGNDDADAGEGASERMILITPIRKNISRAVRTMRRQELLV